MKLILEIKNPGEWEILMAFLLQKGIDFRMPGQIGKRKTATVESQKEELASATVQHEKPAQAIRWEFSNHNFPFPEGATFSREEIYEDADWEKNLY